MAGQTLQLLLVDSSPTVQTALEDILQQQGVFCSFATAASQTEAIDRLQRSPCDVVLLDCTGEKRCDWETLDRLGSCPVVVLVDWHSQPIAMHAIRGGACALLVNMREPDSWNRLPAMIARVAAWRCGTALPVQGDQQSQARPGESPEETLCRVQGALGERVEQRTAVLKAVNWELHQQIVQRAAAEEALRKEKERFRRLVETIPHGIQELDTQGNITFVNAATRAMAGRTSLEMVGTHISGWIKPETELPRILDAFQYLVTEQPTPTPWFLQLQQFVDGAPISVRVDWNYNRDDAGQLTGFVLVITNTTEQSRAEEQARQRLEELAHVSRLSTMGEMVSGLAHEMNQPLAVIANYAQACRRQLQTLQGDGHQSLSEAVEQIVEQAGRAGAIIRHLRDFVRRAASSRSLEDINKLIHDLIVLLEVEARARHVGLELSLHTPLPRLLIDRVQIEQVIVNLVKNAMEAMPAGTNGPRTVTIHTSPAPEGMVEVAVLDTGKGFLDAEAAQLFEPFYTTKADGLGLGLSISRSIVEAHGGRISASPNGGKGSRFCFTLPASSIPA